MNARHGNEGCHGTDSDRHLNFDKIRSGVDNARKRVSKHNSCHATATGIFMVKVCVGLWKAQKCERSTTRLRSLGIRPFGLGG